MNCVLLVWTFVALASLGVNEDIPEKCRPVNQVTCTSNSQCTPSGVTFCDRKPNGSGRRCWIPCFPEKEDPKLNPSLETTPKNVTDGESFTITCARDAGYQLEILKSGPSGNQSIAFINTSVGFGRPGDCLKGVLRIKDTRITINGSAPNRLKLSYSRAQKSDAGQYICCARWNIGGVSGGATVKMMLTVQAAKITTTTTTTAGPDEQGKETNDTKKDAAKTTTTTAGPDEQGKETNDTKKDGEKGGEGGGAGSYIGIAVGAVVLVLLVSAVIYFVLKRKTPPQEGERPAAIQSMPGNAQSEPDTAGAKPDTAGSKPDIAESESELKTTDSNVDVEET